MKEAPLTYTVPYVQYRIVCIVFYNVIL